MFDFQSTIRLRNNGEQAASRHFVNIPKDISDEIKKNRRHANKKMTMTRKSKSKNRVLRSRDEYFS